MAFTHSWIAITLALVAGILAMLELGRHVGLRRQRRSGEAGRPGVAAIDGAVFALMGLLIAFTFSGASTRFEARRALIVEEANAVGTAWLRLDLLADDARAELRQKFRDYLDSRLEIYRVFEDPDALREALARSARIQNEIWSGAIAATRAPAPSHAAVLLLPALNAMIDITTSRLMATRFHQPPLIFGVLVALALASSLLAGIGMAGSRRERWLHMLGFAAVTAGAIYVILDLEYPRRGLIRVDAADSVLVELRASMD